MNILVFSWRDPKHPLAGGAEQVMHEHMKGWIAAGHSVTFFSSNPVDSKKEEVLDAIKIIRRGSQYLTVHIAAFFWYLFTPHDKFDLVVDEFHGWPFFTPVYVRARKLAVIQEITRKVWFRYPLPYRLNLLFGAVGYLIEPLFFLFYKKVPFMTGSESAKDELQTMGVPKQNITVVPHGVIVKELAKKPVKEKIPTVIFLGALASDKGIEDAIKTFGILNKMDKYQFWVVGKGDEKYVIYLKKLAKQVGLGKNITFWGFVSQEEKFKLLARAHIMINPSIREGWGLVNIEANAMATPVIAYNSPGLVDSVLDGKSGIICKENSPQQLADEVHKLLSLKQKYEKLQKQAVWWSKQFTWEKSHKASLDLLNKICKEK